MSSNTLFKSAALVPPVTDALNEAGGVAYRRSAKEALTQYAVTGCFGDTFYVSAELQLRNVLQLMNSVLQESPEYVAKLAIYARTKGYMKDMPALLLCGLSKPEYKALLEFAFPLVISNGKLLRNYVQMMRSGVAGRKSMGTLPKRLVAQWIQAASVDRFVQASVGSSPSLADVIKLTHTKPLTREQVALFAWALGNASALDWEVMPLPVRQLRDFRENSNCPIPNVPFELLTSSDLTPAHWKQIAKQGGWHMTRMNLNTFLRHEVFCDKEIVSGVCAKLMDQALIAKSNVFPYQCLATFYNLHPLIPMEIKIAMQYALETSLQDVPTLEGNVYVFVDVSGSMNSSITGNRGTSTSAVTCVHVASMIAAALLRKNPKTVVKLFNSRVIPAERYVLNPMDSVATLTQQISRHVSGGTSCSAPMAELNQSKNPVDLVIYVSDNESWLDARCHARTAVMENWMDVKCRNPKAKMVCVDLTPNTTTQQPSTIKDILNIGGFSDQVFSLIGAFMSDNWSPQYWVNQVESMDVLLAKS